jgi:3D (Asp-Asp-Asp) domain-containing protein
VRVAIVALLVVASSARADDSKLAKEDVPIQAKAVTRGKNKLCCGYPLADDLGFALRMYWLAFEADHDDPQTPNVPKTGGIKKVPKATSVELYTPEGYYFARVPEQLAWSLRLEGSGMMKDGRIVNTTGRCRFGYGTCFEQLDVREHPFGRGAGWRPLVPFKSVAVDPRIVRIGEPIYIPEFDGLILPDGSIHDGCVRADDTGGGIKKRKMDFFVVTYGNFRFILEELENVTWITPHVSTPRCEYMRDPR